MYRHQKLLDIIKQETNSEIYKTNYTSAIAHEGADETCDDSAIIRVWKSSAEPSQTKKYIDLSSRSKSLASVSGQTLSYFLDSSMQIIRAGEIAYRHLGTPAPVCPVMAAQIGVGCCRRVNRKLFPEKINYEVVIVLPNTAEFGGKGNGFFESMALKLSQAALMQKLNLKVTAILKYTPGQFSSLQENAFSVIQSRMLEQEQALTEDLTLHRKLNQENFLIKDGSLQNVIMNAKKYRFNINNYRWILGVSRSFDPEIRFNSQDNANSGYIADTPVNHRTKAARFEGLGGAEFAVWYIRLRDRTRTNSAFDGVIRVEKMLVTQSEKDKGLDSAFIDTLSAYILNERTHVESGCIYPVFLTQSYIKSRYLGTDSFAQLF